MTLAGFKCRKADNSVFIRHLDFGIVILIVYIDDILLIGTDVKGIDEAKTYLQSQLALKDLGKTQIFFWD